MIRVLIGLVLLVGCTAPGPGTVQPTFPIVTSPSLNPSAEPSSRATPHVQAADIGHLGVIGEPPDKWAVVAVLGDGTPLIQLSPDPTRGRNGVALGRLDTHSGKVVVLIQLPTGKQMGYFSVAGNTLSWVEVNVSDPAAVDWRLHTTAADTGVDRVVDRDPGLKIKASGPWAYSYRPVFWQERESLLYTTFVPGDGNPNTQLQRVGGARTEILTTIADASKNVLARLVADERSVAWVENQLPDNNYLATSTLVVRDNASGATRRQAIPSGFILRFAGDNIVIGAKEGVFVVDRGLVTPLRRLSDAPNVEFIAVLGEDILFSSTNDHRLQTVTVNGGPAVVLESDVVRGPYQANIGNGAAVWLRIAEGTSSIGLLAPR